MKTRRIKRIVMKLDKQTNPKSYLKMPTSDMNVGIRELTGNAYKLLTYMYTKVGNEPFDSEVIGGILNIHPRTVSNAHKELQEKDFLFIEHNTSHDLYVLGLEHVAKYKTDFNIVESQS